MEKLLTLCIPFLSSILFLGFASCSSNLKVNFLLNQQDIEPADNQPQDPNDSLHLLNVMVGDTLYVRDVSEPLSKVKHRNWGCYCGDADVSEGKKNGFFTLLISNSGFQKITLCVNHIEPCVTKWIFAQPAFEPPSSPSFQFIEPSTSSFKTHKRTLDIKIQTENVSGPEDITLTVRGEPFTRVRFEPETGLLTARVPLIHGHNIVEVGSTILDGVESESMEVEYEHSHNASPLGRPDIKITKPVSLFTNKRNVEIEFKARNVMHKREVKITVNGKKVDSKHYRYSKRRRRWVADIHLKLHDNTVLVIANTDVGTDSDQKVINYQHVSPRVSNEPKITPPPPPSKPPSKPAIIGLPLTQYDESCNELFDNRRFSVRLTPSTKVDLESFFVHSDVCGGLQVSLTGPGETQSFKASLTAGQSQISFGTIDARLNKGYSYTLSCKPFSHYGGCNSNNTPKLGDAGNCGIAPNTSTALEIDQQGNFIIYNLKFLY